MDPADASFKKVAQKTLENAPGDQPIPFTPVEARYVKGRIVVLRSGKEFGPAQYLKDKKWQQTGTLHATATGVTIKQGSDTSLTLTRKGTVLSLTGGS